MKNKPAYHNTMTQAECARLIKDTRLRAGLTQAECAAIFGYTPAGWAKKESPGANGRKLSMGEFAYLVELADNNAGHKSKK